MDHFAGFDRLLRVCLHRTMPLHLIGPAGFADRVEHKLSAYTLNLLDAGSINFVIVAAEFSGAGVAPAAVIGQVTHEGRGASFALAADSLFPAIGTALGSGWVSSQSARAVTVGLIPAFPHQATSLPER